MICLMKSGAEEFKAWMDRARLNQRQTAGYFGWDETFISQLVTGKRVPGLPNAIRIERETGIPGEAWVPTDMDTSADQESVDSPKPQLDKA